MKGFKVFIVLVFLASILIGAYFYFENEVNGVVDEILGNKGKNDKPNQISSNAGNGGQNTNGGYVSNLVNKITAIIGGGGGLFGGGSGGDSGSGGSSGSTGGSGRRGGSSFDYIQLSNGQSLPNTKQGNGYILTHLFSHSRVATPVQDTPNGAFASCEVWLYFIPTGELVWHLSDSIGGYHPNFFNSSERGGKNYQWIDDWANNFQPYGSFSSAQDRGNNHFPEYQKYLREGQYELVYLNNSNTKHTVTAGFIQGGNGADQLNEIFAPSKDPYKRTINITPNGNSGDEFKLNSNNYVL